MYQKEDEYTNELISEEGIKKYGEKYWKGFRKNSSPIRLSVKNNY